MSSRLHIVYLPILCPEGWPRRLLPVPAKDGDQVGAIEADAPEPPRDERKGTGDRRYGESNADDAAKCLDPGSFFFRPDLIESSLR